MSPTHPTWPQGRFDGRHAWGQRLREVLALALQDRVWQMSWCDTDFADWPLGERAVVDALHAWAHAGGSLNLLALDYRPVMQHHARFVQWRITWSHRVEARVAPREVEEGFPTLLCVPGWAMQRTTTAAPVVLAGGEPARVQALHAQWQELWERSSPGFPATTLGLGA